jgi:CBS domain-containing protein
MANLDAWLEMLKARRRTATDSVKLATRVLPGLREARPRGREVLNLEAKMQVRELMTRSPYGVQIHESVQRATELMKRHGVGAVVVYNYDLPVGMLTDRDIAVECVTAGHQASACAVREHMTADPLGIAEDATLEDALQMMGAEQVRRLLVLEGPSVVGIVTLGDLAVRAPDHAAVGRALAEISQPVRAGVA